mgnify:FL=1
MKKLSNQNNVKNKNNLEQLNQEIAYLEEEIQKLKQQNKVQKIRIERKNLELQKNWLKELGIGGVYEKV